MCGRLLQLFIPFGWGVLTRRFLRNQLPPHVGGVAYAHVAAVNNNKHGKEAVAHAKRTTCDVKRRSALEELIAAGSDPELRGKLDTLGAAPSADMLMVFKIPQLKALIAAKACVPKR